MRLYSIIAITSYLLRNYYFPNPFESLGVYADIANIVFEPLLFIITFFTVGLVYEKGSFPALGSFLYLVFYGIHISIIYLIVSNYWAHAFIAIVCYVWVLKQLRKMNAYCY